MPKTHFHSREPSHTMVIKLMAVPIQLKRSFFRFEFALFRRASTFTKVCIHLKDQYLIDIDKLLLTNIRNLGEQNMFRKCEAYVCTVYLRCKTAIFLSNIHGHAVPYSLSKFRGSFCVKTINKVHRIDRIQRI